MSDSFELLYRYGAVTFVEFPLRFTACAITISYALLGTSGSVVTIIIIIPIIIFPVVMVSIVVIVYIIIIIAIIVEVKNRA